MQAFNRYSKIALVLSFAVLVGIIACQPMGTTDMMETEFDEEMPTDEEVSMDEAGAIIPEAIPAEFGFPADRDMLQTLIDTNGIDGMRAHSWQIWAGMTADSQSAFNGATLPIWETWLATQDVFADESPLAGSVHTSPKREFVKPNQFLNAPLPVSQEEVLVMGFNKFNPAMAAYIWGTQPDSELPYVYQQGLTAINDSWPADTPIEKRIVTEAPPNAIELKPVLMWVSAERPTVLPFWQGPGGSTRQECQGIDIDQLRQVRGNPATKCTPDDQTWASCVIIDPQAATDALAPATQQQFDQLNSKDKSQAPGCTDAANAQYGGLNLIYSFMVDADQAKSLNANAQAGDHAVLVAMHVTTKEVINWTWQSFWWQGGQNPPDNFPGHLADMTDDVQGAWKNYAMCSSYSQTVGTNNEGEMNICFNPYLEAVQPDGIRSNCVSCHGMARYPLAINKYPQDYSEPISYDDPALFGEHTRTDFSWAIPENAVFNLDSQ